MGWGKGPNKAVANKVVANKAVANQVVANKVVAVSHWKEKSRKGL